MTADDTPIAAHAAQRAQARGHWHCACSPEWITWKREPDRAPHTRHEHGFCERDHRTPAEQRADILGKLADVWAWMEADGWFTGYVERLYAAIQRTEVTE